MEWIHDEYSVVVKHAQTMLQLVKFGIDWKCGELEQTVNIPVTQIVEEIADREHSSYSDCGRDQRGEYSNSTECGRDRRGEQILE